MTGPSSAMTISEPFEIDGHKLALTTVSMGNPHAIFFVKKDELHFHQTIGPKIEKNSLFPEGINVEFVAIENETSLLCRVWERGSGVTQACGTGACAVAIAAILNGYARKEKNITVHLAGGDLQICWQENGDVYMTGPATLSAIGMTP